MKTTHADFFPETLLVSLDERGMYTTSLKVAEYFGKRHDHVVRDIFKLCADMDVLSEDPVDSSLNFEERMAGPSTNSLPKIGERISVADHLDFLRSGRWFEIDKYSYVTAKGQQRQANMFHIGRDGFALLSMGFTGMKALAWKLKFLQAFNDMERQLSAQRDRYVAALDQVRPSLRPVVEGTQDGQSRAAIAQPLGKSCAAVTYHRSQARRLGLLSD